MKNAVEMKNISFSFNTPNGEHFVLKDISFDVKEANLFPLQVLQDAENPLFFP